ncbi:MAG: hypothetical protein H6765_07905 [Candidatus Peribacteria bacterium]|nr:MAG: hypothetical protein H6765_07905 [Candidatus Peribacteria bacterium]
MNKTLFRDFVDLSRIVSTEEAAKLVEDKLQAVLELLSEYQAQVEIVAQCSWNDQITLHWSEYVFDMLQIVKIGLPFELEKAGYTCKLDMQERQDRVHALGKLEQKWFGPLVQNETFEVSRSLALLSLQVKKDGKRLSKSERDELMKYINQGKKLRKYRKELEEMEESEWIMDSLPEFQKKISREVYAQVFALALDFYGLEIPVVVDERSSIYDGWSALHIPANEGYETLPLQKVIELIQHEIETHYLIQANTKYLLGDIRGGANLLREEGLAKFNEEVINGASLASFDVSPSMSQVLLGEILQGEEFERFMYLYWKLQGDVSKYQ